MLLGVEMGILLLNINTSFNISYFFLETVYLERLFSLNLL